MKKDETGKKCTVCNSYITGGLTQLNRHDLSENHKKKVNAAKTTPKIDNFLTSSTKCTITESAKKLEIMLSAFVAEHNLPFTVLDHLNFIIKEGVHDSQITKKFNIHRKNGKELVTNLLGPENSKDIQNFCKNHHFSLVIDESTDCSISKNLAIVIRIFDGISRDRFLSLVQIADSTASGIFNTTLHVLRKITYP